MVSQNNIACRHGRIPCKSVIGIICQW
jgi:hypothetical protein